MLCIKEMNEEYEQKVRPMLAAESRYAVIFSIKYVMFGVSAVHFEIAENHFIELEILRLLKSSECVLRQHFIHVGFL